MTRKLYANLTLPDDPSVTLRIECPLLPCPIDCKGLAGIGLGLQDLEDLRAKKVPGTRIDLRMLGRVIEWDKGTPINALLNTINRLWHERCAA
jgi:hypothetical protein